MTDAILRWDEMLFRFINGKLANPVFDVLMPFITDLNHFKPLLVALLLLILWLLIRGGRKGRMAVAALFLTILLSDQLNSSFLKFLFERPRPCHVLSDIRLLVGCGSGFSFPSSHAVNHFAGAIVLSYFYPRGTPWLFGFAATVAFSRIYVGVHYPMDVFGGALVGLCCGAVVLSGVMFVERRSNNRPELFRSFSKRKENGAA